MRGVNRVWKLQEFTFQALTTATTYPNAHTPFWMWLCTQNHPICLALFVSYNGYTQLPKAGKKCKKLQLSQHLFYHQKELIDTCHVSIMNSTHFVVWDTCLPISESLWRSYIVIFFHCNWELYDLACDILSLCTRWVWVQHTLNSFSRFARTLLHTFFSQ